MDIPTTRAKPQADIIVFNMHIELHGLSPYYNVFIYNINYTAMYSLIQT